jgi:hypothetical protein
MPTLTDEQIEQNLETVARAVAQQELEGLKVSDVTVADLRRAARGEIDTAEVMRNIRSRLQNVPLLRQ